MRSVKVLAAGFALASFAAPGVAEAQTKYDEYSYRFEDDAMVGDTLSSPPPPLTLRRRIPRVMLLRPRAAFVAELLKSVEAL